MSVAPGNARAFYLELAALGIDVRTGAVPELEFSCAGIAALRRQVRENRPGFARSWSLRVKTTVRQIAHSLLSNCHAGCI